MKKEERGLFSLFLQYKRLKKVANYIKEKNTKILDIGCGNGYLLNFLSGFKEYTGIDKDKKLIELNKREKQKKNIKFYYFDISKIDKLKQIYDYFVLAAVIEHITNFESILKKIEKISARKAKIIITTPDKKGDLILKFGSKLGLFSKESNKEHVRYYDKNEFRALNSWKPVVYKKFELGLNQFIVLEKLINSIKK